MLHVVHKVDVGRHRVATYGKDGKRLALQDHYPTHEIAVDRALAMAALCGGEVVLAEITVEGEDALCAHASMA